MIKGNDNKLCNYKFCLFICQLICVMIENTEVYKEVIDYVRF